jgi:hypothetical protein
MKSEARKRLVCAAAAMAIILFGATTVQANAFTSGSASIANVQYGLVNQGAGTINWYGGWQGEAWVETSDSQGGSNADYSATPDAFGVVGASASTSLTNGSASVDLEQLELSIQGNTANPANGWALSAPHATMYNYFSIMPAVTGNTDPIEASFAFDYTIHLSGQAEPGAGYYSDAMVSMFLESEDNFGNWEPVPNGQLSSIKNISGSGTDSDNVTFTGQGQMIIWLKSYVNYSIVYQMGTDVPEPCTLLLVGFGSLALLRKRKP